MLRMAFCVCLGFLMGAYLAKGFSQDNGQVINPIIDTVITSVNTSVQTVEQSFFDTSFHMLLLKYDKTYRDNFDSEENSNIIAYIADSNLKKDSIFSNLALNISERTIMQFYGEALSNAAKSDAIVTEKIRGFKDLCIEQNGYLLDYWDSSKPMEEFKDKWLFKPIFWYKGTGIGIDSGVVCLKST